MKVEFITPLIAERLSERRAWRLERNFRCDIDGRKVIVPAGFITNLASVPRLPFVYYLAGGRGVKAATLHDYLYHAKEPRGWADAVFLQALRAEGEPEPIALAMYAAVKAGGGAHYDEGKALDVATVDSPPPP